MTKIIENKAKCLICGDIIEGDKQGHLISCSCNKCYIDETPDFWRIGGDPKQIAIFDENGNEYEFLADYFEDKYEALSMVFLKGYQWPFDSKKVLCGSSVIDLLVYRECVLAHPFALAILPWYFVTDSPMTLPSRTLWTTMVVGAVGALLSGVTVVLPLLTFNSSGPASPTMACPLVTTPPFASMGI